MRTVIFGVDGLTFRVLHPLIERGELPHFQRLSQEGYEAVLESQYPPLTPPAWISLFTGLKPARHGVYDYWSYEERGDGLPPAVSVNTRRRGGKAIWNILSEYGKRVLIVNVPMTYPPEPVNGVMISGYLTPEGCDNYTYPLNFKEEVQRIAPGYTIDLDLHSIFNGKPHEENTRLINATLHMTKLRIKLLEQLLREQPWDFCYIVFVGADRLQHPLWEDIIALDSLAIEYYRLLDVCLGLIVEQLEPEDCLFVVSDHGFQGVDRCFDINEYLYSKNMLALDPACQRARSLARHVNGLKQMLRQTHLFPLAQKMKVTLRDAGMLRDTLPDISQPLPIGIDWARTLACVPSYSSFPGGYADIFLHPELDRELITALCEDLRKQVDPVTHRPLLAAIFSEEVFGAGHFARKEPHLLLLPSDGITFNTRLGNQRFWDNAYMANFSGKRCGVHHKDGVLYACGGGIKRGAKGLVAQIYDIVPTVLRAMDVVAPYTFDGRVLDELFIESGSGSSIRDAKEGIVQRKLKQIQREGKAEV